MVHVACCTLHALHTACVARCTLHALRDATGSDARRIAAELKCADRWQLNYSILWPRGSEQHGSIACVPHTHEALAADEDAQRIEGQAAASRRQTVSSSKTHSAEWSEPRNPGVTHRGYRLSHRMHTYSEVVLQRSSQ